MACKDTLQVDLFAAARDGQVRTFDLSDDFFQELDQEEILGGLLHVTLTVREGAGELFHVHYIIKGVVKVTCDRCLGELALDVNLDDNLSISYADVAPTNDDIRYLPPREKVYDFAWDFYEAVELSLPMQRTHAIEDCAPNMLAHIQN